MPPSTGWSLAKDGRPPMPSFEFVYDRPAPPPSPEQPRRSFFGQLFGRRQSSANAEASSSSSSEPPPSAEVRQLIDMGFARDRVEGALRRADNDTALALNILLDPEAAAETAAAAEPEPAAQVSSAAAVAKTAAVAADARGWARVADRSAPLAQLLAEEFGEEGGAALLDQAAAAATAAAAAEAAAPPTPPLTLTIDQGFSGSQQDHEKHPWASVDLPAGYASGTLKVSWKDQGYRQSQRAAVVPEAVLPYQGQSPPDRDQRGTSYRPVAEHSWTQAEFEVPAACFERPRHTPASRLEPSLHSRARLRGRRRRRPLPPCARRRDAHAQAGFVGRSAAAGPPRPAAPPPSLPPQPAAPGGPSAATLAREAAGYAGPLVGDCLEVRDTHELWAVARVVASIEDINLGPLILVHFEVVDVVADVDPSRTRRGEGARPRQQRIGVEHRQGRRPAGHRLARRAHGGHLPQHGRRSTRNAAFWTGVAADRRARSHVPVHQRAHLVRRHGQQRIQRHFAARAARSAVERTRWWKRCSVVPATSSCIPRSLQRDVSRALYADVPGVLWRTATRTANGRGALMSRRAMGAIATRTRDRATRCAKA